MLCEYCLKMNCFEQLLTRNMRRNRPKMLQMYVLAIHISNLRFKHVLAFVQLKNMKKQVPRFELCLLTHVSS
jgi:hypothetical protein